MSEPSRHPAIQPLAFLLGTWRGAGKGEYPTIAAFAYEEESRFWHAGKPWIGYEQRTWNPETKAPMHAETGYWRPIGDGRIEVVLAHPTGVAEIQEGTIDGARIMLRSTAIAATTTAKEVTALARTITVIGDTLSYELAMGAVGLPLQPHLAATLRRGD